MYVAAAMPAVGPRLLFALLLGLGFGPQVALAQLRASRRPRPLPPIPAADGPLVLRVVYPPLGAQVTARDSTFLFGSTGSGRSSLSVNGQEVAVAPNGAFLAWIALPADTATVLRLVARRGTDSVVALHRVRLPARFVPPAAGLWLDRGSLEPRGNRWVEPGELIRVRVRAAAGAGVALRLPNGRLVPLAPDPDTTLDSGPFERLPSRAPPRAEARYAGVFPATPLGAPLPHVTAVGVGSAAWDSVTGASIVVTRGADTVRAPLPLRLTLLDPAQPAVVVLDDDTARVGNTDGAVEGTPTPDGTYHWLFRNGTVAAVSGRAGDYVRLRLSRAASAWVRLAVIAGTLPAGTPAPQSRVALVRLVPGDSGVTARIVLGARLPFRVDEDERALTLRLYGAQSDLDWVQYGGTDPLVRRVTWAQPSDDECAVTFELAPRVFGWRARWEQADLHLEIRRPPEISRDRPLRGRTIAVDPGHPPVGATGPTGLREAEANLAVGLELKRLLERAGARVVLTRAADSALGLYERTLIAERSGAEILVSIHNNAFPDGVNPFVNNGTSTYYFHPRGARLAFLVQDALVGELGLPNLGVGRANLALARPTWMPAILTEGAFLMVPEQENALRTPSFQEAYARGVALGVEAYLRELAMPP